MIRYLLLAAVVLMALTGCTRGVTPNGEQPLAGSSEQLPEEAQRYVDMSRQALQSYLKIEPARIALDSVTEPAKATEVYTVKLAVESTTYTYHGQAGGVSLISIDSQPPTVP